MKWFYKQSLFLSGLILLYLGGCTETPARSPSSPPQTPVAALPAPHQLSQKQQADLRTLGIPVLIPAYVPAGFRVDRVNADACKTSPKTGFCREGPHYAVIYRNAQNQCLDVRAVGGGVGGGYGEFELRTKTPLLGQVIIEFGALNGANTPAQPNQLTSPQPNLSSFPAQLTAPGTRRSPYYSVSAGDGDYYRTTYGCRPHTSLTPAELEKVLQSLAILK